MSPCGSGEGFRASLFFFLSLILGRQCIAPKCMSSELSAWAGPWDGRPPWQDPSYSLFCCSISPLRLQDRTEPWEPEGQSHHSPPSYLHKHTHTGICTHSHTLRHKTCVDSCMCRKKREKPREKPDQGQMPDRMVPSQRISIVLSSHVCCPTWALPPKNFALTAPCVGH